MKRKFFIIIVFLSLLLTGCFHDTTREKKIDAMPTPTPTEQESPEPTSIPKQTENKIIIDENDYLDEAFNDLDSVE